MLPWTLLPVMLQHEVTPACCMLQTLGRSSGFPNGKASGSNGQGSVSGVCSLQAGVAAGAWPSSLQVSETGPSRSHCASTAGLCPDSAQALGFRGALRLANTTLDAYADGLAQQSLACARDNTAVSDGRLDDIPDQPRPACKEWVPDDPFNFTFDMDAAACSGDGSGDVFVRADGKVIGSPYPLSESDGDDDDADSA